MGFEWVSGDSYWSSVGLSFLIWEVGVTLDRILKKQPMSSTWELSLYDFKHTMSQS